MMNNAAEAYKRQQIMTATPEALTLMLYDGCLRFMKEGMEAMKEKSWEQSKAAIIKAENIINEFRVTLKLEYEIGRQLMPLYDYVYNSLVEANMHSKPEKIEECIGIIKELRTAWAQAIIIARKEKGAS